jgi:hypothetical protein
MWGSSKLIEECMLMAERQRRRVNEAAEQFANAIMESQRTMAQRGVSLQEINAQLTRQFLNDLIDNLRMMTEETRGASQELADQIRRAQQAARTLTQETAGGYVEFMNSLFAMSQGALRRGAGEAGRGTTTREAQRTSSTTTTTTATETPPERQAGAEGLPLEDYDSLTVEQISQRLDGLGPEEIRQLRAYEAENKNRSTLLQRLDERIEAGSPS